MPHLFCHEHPETLDLETSVVDARPGRVALPQTPFYPGGGGRIAPPPRDRVLFARAVALMRQRRADSLPLEELAGALGLTVFQLIGLFKRSVGLTPHAYLTQLRLYRACRELRRGRPIAETASAAGFYDQSALTRHFKRCYGMTPLQFARAARA